MKRTAGRLLSHIATVILLLLCSLFAFAGPERTTYQAKIIKPDGYPLEASNVNFKFTILDPAGVCILYSETYSAVNMTSTGGLISFSLGSGVKTYPVSSPTFADVFSNITPNFSCDAGGPPSYTPSANDIRKIVMQFHDGAGWQTLPAMSINAVPYAMYANNAEKLAGLGAADFVQVSTVPTCTASEAIRYNGTVFSCVAVGSGDGTVTSGSVIAALGYTPADVSNLTTVTTNVSNVSSTVFSVSSTLTTLTATVSSITSSQWVTSGTAIHYSNGFVGIGIAVPITALDVSGGVRISMEAASCIAALAGTLRYNASNVEYCNGTSWQAFGVSGAGITNFNGSTSGTQSFATAAGGTAPNFNTLNGVHTLNIPLASTGSVTGGLLSNADYTTFTNKITSSAASIVQVLGYVPADNAASGTYAQKANNLSDLTNIATARTNLGLGTFATASSIDLGGASATGTLAIARLPSFTGDATIAAASNTIILSNSGVMSGTYVKVTVDAKGRVTSGAQLLSADVTTALGYTPASASAASQWTTSGSAIYYNSGNVGINSAIPANALNVIGRGTSANTLLGSMSNAAVVIQPNTASLWGIGFGVITGASYTQYVQAANPAGTLAKNFAVNPFGGNVGIGVSAPEARLHLSSGSTAASAAPLKFTSGTLMTTAEAGALEYDGFNFYITDSTNTRRIIASDNNANFTAGNIVASGSLNLTNSANLYLTANAVDPGDIIFQEASGTQKGRIWSNPSAIGLFLSSGDATPDITINAAGNVGIGTQTPTEKLEVSGAIKVPGVGQIGPAGTFGYAMYTTGTNNFIGQMYGSASGVQFTNSTGINTMSIQDNGDVSIGSIAPVTRLTVSANAANANLVTLYNSAHDGVSGLNTYSSSGTLVGGLGWGNYNAAPSYKEKFFINSSKDMTFITNNAERMGITSSGLVGIGIAPTTILSISASNPTVQIMDAELNPGDGSLQGKVAFGSGGAEWGSIALTRISGFADDVNDIVFKNSFATGAGGPGNNNERMRIKYNGYVGIGTSAPTNTLDIVGVGLNVTREQTFGTLATFRKAYTAVSNEDPYVQFLHQTASGGAFGRYGYIQSGQSHNGMTIQGENGSGTPANLMLNKLGGSVGVGTANGASMTAKFNIVGSSGGEIAQYIHNTNPAGYSVIRMNNNWGGFASGTALHSFGPGYGSAGSAYSPLTTTLTGFESGGLNLHAEAGPIRFFTGGNIAANQQMHLTSTGNLGIGTSAPAVKTHIYSQVDGPFVGLAIDNRKIYGAGTGTNETSRMIFSLSEPTVPNVVDRVMGYIEAGTHSETSSADTFMAFGTRSGGPGTETEKMRINYLGNVGIGTSSPVARLNIGGLGATNATALRIDSQDTFYRDIFISEFNTTTYGGLLRYNSGSDLLQLITLENGVEKYGIAVARATGFVGVGRNSAAAYQLDVSGSVRISGEAFRDDGVATWAMTSDARLKDVVSSYDRGLNEILNIDTIIFKYKKDNPKKLNSTKEFPGVLAQQVQKVIPEAVDTDKDGFLSLNTTPIIWAMLNAIKDVYHEVTGVQREIASLKEDNKAKEQEIKDLKERLDRIEKSLQNK